MLIPLICSILGLRCDASDENIKKYYRKQAVLVHPDKVWPSLDNKMFLDNSTTRTKNSSI